MSNPAPDPIATIVTGLTFIAAPNPVPAPAAGSFAPPDAYASPNDATPGAVSPIIFTTLLGGLGGIAAIQPEIQDIYTAIGSALTPVASGIMSIATALNSIEAQLTGGVTINDVTDAISGLQGALALAQSIAPSSASSTGQSPSNVLTSISGLLGQVQTMLTAIINAATTAGTDLTQVLPQAASEMASLSQQLSYIGQQFTTLGQA